MSISTSDQIEVNPMDDNKAKVRAIYYELQGYLSQTPVPHQPSDIFAGDDSWLQYNQAVEELSKITGDDYSRFMIKPNPMNGHNIVHLTTYRQTLGGIINRIHGIYFPDENMPFSGSPQTVISQTQNQSQSIQLVLDLQSRIDEEITTSKNDPKKLGFLNKMKSGLSHVKDANDLLKLLLKLFSVFG
jgi:hypothetical protein